MIKYKNSFLFLLIIYNLNSKIIHEENPFFLENYPVIIDINFSNEHIVKSELFYATAKKKGEFQMVCNDNYCFTIVDTSTGDEYIEYVIRVSLKSGEELETLPIKIKKLSLPEWQIAENISGFETIESSKDMVKGFSLNGFSLINNKIILKKKKKKIKIKLFNLIKTIKI